MVYVIILYAGILLCGLFSILIRKKVMLLLGKHFFRYNLFFFVSVIVVTIINNQLTKNFPIILLLGGFFILSLLLESRWLIIRYDVAKVSIAIEESLSRILLSYRKIGSEYIIANKDLEDTILQIMAFPPKCAVFNFKGQVKTKKFAVLQKLLKKHFEGVFPPLIVRL